MEAYKAFYNEIAAEYDWDGEISSRIVSNRGNQRRNSVFHFQSYYYHHLHYCPHYENRGGQAVEAAAVADEVVLFSSLAHLVAVAVDWWRWRFGGGGGFRGGGGGSGGGGGAGRSW